MVRRIVVLSVIALCVAAGCKSKADQLAELYELSIAVSATLTASLEKAGTPEEVAAAFAAWGDGAAKVAATQKELQKTDPIAPSGAQMKMMMEAVSKQATAIETAIKKFPNNRVIMDAYTTAAQKVAKASK